MVVTGGQQVPQQAPQMVPASSSEVPSAGTSHATGDDAERYVLMLIGIKLCCFRNDKSLHQGNQFFLGKFQ